MVINMKSTKMILRLTLVFVVIARGGNKETSSDKNDVSEKGAWSISDQKIEDFLPDSVDWIWSKVSPLAYLGSQVVAVNNYALICKGESASEERADSMMIVTIYEDLDRKSELSNIHLLDLADFTDQ